MLSHAFSRSNLLLLEDFVTEEVCLLVEQFYKACQMNRPVDLLKWYRFLAADVIGKLHAVSFSSI